MKKIIKNFKDRLFIYYQYSFLFLYNLFIEVYSIIYFWNNLMKILMNIEYINDISLFINHEFYKFKLLLKYILYINNIKNKNL